jgi:hypothetical protein
LIIPPAAKFAVIRFLQAKNTSAVEIHRELCAVVNGKNVTSEGSVRQGYRMLKEGKQMFMIKSAVVAICSE